MAKIAASGESVALAAPAVDAVLARHAFVVTVCEISAFSAENVFVGSAGLPASERSAVGSERCVVVVVGVSQWPVAVPAAEQSAGDKCIAALLSLHLCLCALA